MPTHIFFVFQTTEPLLKSQRFIGLRLKKATKLTDWSPAPEDLTADAQTKAVEALASAKTYADAQIKVTADSINQNVTKKFDDLQVGGRNLAIGTNNGKNGWIVGSNDGTIIANPKVFSEFGNVNGVRFDITKNASSWNFALYESPSIKSILNASIGEDFTISFDYKSDVSSYIIVNVQNNNASDRMIDFNGFVSSPNKWNHVKLTAKPIQANITNQQIYLGYLFSKGTFVEIVNLKLERGNKATDWTPAPEDLATADNVNDKLTELHQEVNSNIEQTGEAIKSSVYEKVYLKDDVDTLLSSVNTEVEQTKTSWQVTFNQLVKQFERLLRWLGCGIRRNSQVYPL